MKISWCKDLCHHDALMNVNKREIKVFDNEHVFKNIYFMLQTLWASQIKSKQKHKQELAGADGTFRTQGLKKHFWLDC